MKSINSSSTREKRSLGGENESGQKWAKKIELEDSYETGQERWDNFELIEEEGIN